MDSDDNSQVHAIIYVIPAINRFWVSKYPIIIFKDLSNFTVRILKNPSQ